MATEAADARTVHLKPSSYRPSKAELKEEVRIEAPPEDVARAVARLVQITTGS